MEHLSGKVGVVTGAASGIGFALAKRFGAVGMSVVVADVDSPALEAACVELRKEGAQVLAVPTDVTDPTAVDELARAAMERFGAYHVICNNAGVGGHFGRTWETPLRDWRWVFEVNIWGVIHGIRSFVPGLVAQHEGHVVNTASLAAWMGGPTMAPYAASKHAVLAISESLRIELEASGAGVGVSVLCPGGIDTKIMSSERNWLSRLGDEPPVPSDELTATMRDLLAGITSGGLNPSVAAEAVVAGIKTNRFIVTTHPDDLIGAAQTRLGHAQEAAH